MTKRKKKDFWLKRMFHSSWLFIGLLVILVLFSIALFREVMRKIEIRNEINDLENQVAFLEKNNTQLETLLTYLETDEYIEKESREKLGYKKEGETVVAVPATDQLEVNASGLENATAVSKNNWQLWNDYFFY